MSQKLKLKNKFIPVNTPKIFSQEKMIRDAVTIVLFKTFTNIEK